MKPRHGTLRIFARVFGLTYIATIHQQTFNKQKDSDLILTVISERLFNECAISEGLQALVWN